MTPKRIGVLVMSYGTPESLDQIMPYYTHIRRGNPPSPEQLAELTSRYEAIVGGVFPLREHTNRQVAALEALLNREGGGTEYVCRQGLKHARPYVADGVEALKQAGVDSAVGIVLAPHYSSMSVGSYIKQAEDKARELDLPMTFVKSYHLNPHLLQALVERVDTKLAEFAAEGTARDQVQVFFTAHSLPESILAQGDPYPQQLQETAAEIARQSGITKWSFAWQSAGRTSVPWLGPDILEVLTHAREEGEQQMLICPIGFVSDHLEILYDIDIECQQKAAMLGINLKRTASLNDDPQYIAALQSAVEEIILQMAAAKQG
jgi:ferrochelatase